MKRKLSNLALLAGAALFVLSVATAASGADVAKLVEGCIGCHGKDGASTVSNFPVIGGYSSEYLSRSLAAYKKKSRPCPGTVMCQATNNLSDGDINDIAKFFAEKPFVRAKQKIDPALAKRGKEIHVDGCERCHTEGGSVAANDAGILAGQWMPYLEEAFKAFKSGERPMPRMMKSKFNDLDKGAVEALIHYYGSFN